MIITNRLLASEQLPAAAAAVDWWSVLVDFRTEEQLPSENNMQHIIVAQATVTYL